MKMFIIQWVIVMTAMVAGFSCQQAESSLEDPEVDLIGPMWQLTAFAEADGDYIFIDRGSGTVPESAYTIRFTRRSAQECISTGNDAQGVWCTELTGYPNSSPSTTYCLNNEDDSFLRIYFRGSTFVGRPSGSREEEFCAAIDAVTSYQINGTELQLLHNNGKALLFKPLVSQEG